MHVFSSQGGDALDLAGMTVFRGKALLGAGLATERSRCGAARRSDRSKRPRTNLLSSTALT